MPHLYIETNLPKDKVPSTFLNATVEKLSELLKKPKSYCVVSIHPDTMMTWGGTSDICGIAKLMSIGGIDPQKNNEIADVLHEFFKQQLGIAKNRLYIQYVDQDAAYLSYEGQTFRQIFG